MCSAAAAIPLTIRTTSDLPGQWNSVIEFWDTLETYMLVPLGNWGTTEQSQYEGQNFFVRFHHLAAPNLPFSRNGRTVRFSSGANYSTDLFPGRPFNAGATRFSVAIPLPAARATQTGRGWCKLPVAKARTGVLIGRTGCPAQGPIIVVGHASTSPCGTMEAPITDLGRARSF